MILWEFGTGRRNDKLFSVLSFLWIPPPIIPSMNENEWLYSILRRREKRWSLFVSVNSSWKSQWLLLISYFCLKCLLRVRLWRPWFGSRSINLSRIFIHCLMGRLCANAMARIISFGLQFHQIIIIQFNDFIRKLR